MAEPIYSIRPLTPDDKIPVMDIFNYYIENSFAAYPERTLDYEFYERLLGTTQGYPTAALVTAQNKVIGF
ncbi:MAG: hypothetical protein AAGU05_08995, partial [Anaerolineaceae bacterium]